MKLLFTVSEEAHVVDEDEHVQGSPINFCWQTQGNYLATSGSDAKVIVFDRHGDVVEEIGLSGLIN